MDTLGHLLALRITSATEQERGAQVGELAQAVQEVTSESVELAYGDRGWELARRRATAAGLHFVALTCLFLYLAIAVLGTDPTTASR